MGRPRVKRGGKRSRGAETPLSAYTGSALGFLGAYLAAKVALATRMHPIHWATALGGGIAGFLFGLLWYRYWD